MFVQISRSLFSLDALEPANVIIIAFAAIRTRKTRRFDLLPLVKNIAFLHGDIISFRAMTNRADI